MCVWIPARPAWCVSGWEKEEEVEVFDSEVRKLGSYWGFVVASLDFYFLWKSEGWFGIGGIWKFGSIR